jgi:hypothetical protein
MGSVAARLPGETTWPVRVAVRVRPGSVQQIESPGRGAQRAAGAPRAPNRSISKLAPSVYRPDRGYLHFVGVDAGVRRCGGA